MNDIVRPLTKDGLVGWDKFGQFWIWKLQEGGGREGSIYHDVREKICCVCGHGWEITADSLRDQYFWDGRAEWSHITCLMRYLSLQEFEFWRGALVEAGFMFGPIDNPRMIAQGGPSLQAIPNEYWRRDPVYSLQPWYRVRLLKRVSEEPSLNGPHGRTLKLGQRKRVYHLEIEEGDGHYDPTLAAELFKAEDVTKEIGVNSMMIHAWGRDKAREYLKRFARILGVPERK